LLSFIFPAIGLGFYFIGSVLIISTNIVILTSRTKSKMYEEDCFCEDCLGSIVEDEINKPQSRYERRHPKSKKGRN